MVLKMYICYFKNSNIASNKKEFLYIENFKLIGTYNPKKAEKFNTLEEMNVWIKKYIARQDDILHTQEIELETEIFLEWVETPTYRTSPILSEHSYQKTNETPEEVFAWWVKYHDIVKNNKGSINHDDYSTWQMFGLFQNIKELVSYSRYEKNSETTYSVEMSVGEDDCFDKFKMELSLALSFVTYVEEDDSNILRLPIYDYALCEFGMYFLYVLPDNTYDIGSYEPDNKVGGKSLEEIFKYWKRNRPRDRKEDEE
jgi:hypothetical protein